MAHHTVKSAYSSLADRLNRHPQGAPPSDLLFKILKMLVSEREAGLVAQMPIKPFSPEKAARIWNMDLPSARKVLEELASRAILVDLEQNGRSWYALPPPMAGFFEFSMMRVRDDIDQTALSELFHQYLNVEEDFVRDLFTRGDTQFGRTFVHEPALSEENALHVLDYERAGEVVRNASRRSVGMCYCRHKADHLQRACDAPMNICMTFNHTAASLVKHGHAREVGESECLDLLQEARDRSLVQFGENVQEEVNFICNCCGCCCEAMMAARRFAILNPVHTTNFIPVLDLTDCNGCGRCVNACPVEAMTLISANQPDKPKMKQARLDEELCLGCGLCVRACNKDSICLQSRPQRVLTPVNGTHKALVMALERGKLQNLIFDNRVLWSHRAMAAFLGAILKLPPVQRTLAGKELKSRYIETLIERFGN